MVARNLDSARGQQEALNDLGFGPLRVDGVIGPKTKAAIMAFQVASGLKVDAAIGPKTRAALRLALSERVTPIEGVDQPATVRAWRYTAHLPEAFFVRLVDLGKRRGISALGLLALMLSESGVRADRRNGANPSSGAVGLIQFMPDICASLFGMQVDRMLGEDGDAFAERKRAAEQAARARMLMIDAVGQLAYVEAFLAAWIRFGLTSLERLYQSLFLPATLPVARGLDDVICGVDGPYAWAYRDNKVLDYGGDGRITQRDLGDHVRHRAIAGNREMWRELVSRMRAAGSTEPDPADETPSGSGMAVAGLVLLGLLIGGAAGLALAKG